MDLGSTGPTSLRSNCTEEEEEEGDNTDTGSGLPEEGDDDDEEEEDMFEKAEEEKGDGHQAFNSHNSSEEPSEVRRTLFGKSVEVNRNNTLGFFF